MLRHGSSYGSPGQSDLCVSPLQANRHAQLTAGMPKSLLDSGKLRISKVDATYYSGRIVEMDVLGRQQFGRHGLLVASRHSDWRGSRFQRVQVVSPNLHHLAALAEELCPIVCSAKCIWHLMSKLMLDHVGIEM